MYSRTDLLSYQYQPDALLDLQHQASRLYLPARRRSILAQLGADHRREPRICQFSVYDVNEKYVVTVRYKLKIRYHFLLQYLVSVIRVNKKMKKIILNSRFLQMCIRAEITTNNNSHNIKTTKNKRSIFSTFLHVLLPLLLLMMMKMKMLCVDC